MNTEIKTIKKSFVSKELASRLKGKGFNLPVIATYSDIGELTLFDYEFERSSELIAPLYDQAFNWLNSQGIEIVVFPKFYGIGKCYYYAYECLVMDRNDLESMKGLAKGAFTLYETKKEAYDKAIEEALTLIK